MSKLNARKEFEDHVREVSSVKCAILSWGDPNCSWRDVDVERVLLYPGFTDQDYNEFLSRINTNYDCGLGGQELYGTIWYTDGTWSDRREYDGSEWWEHQSCPAYPEEFNHVCSTVSPNSLKLLG